MAELQVSREEVERRIKFILDKEFDVDQAMIMPGSRVIEDLGLEAIDSIELILHIEEKFGINLDGQCAQLETFDQFVSLVTRICNGQ